MKKLLVYCAIGALFLFNSCSSDGNGDNSKVSAAKATIDGVTYSFNTFHVSTENFTDDNHSYTDVTVTASIDNDPNRVFTIIVEKGMIGLHASYYFAYFVNGSAYPKNSDFITQVTKSTGDTIEATFSGTVTADDGSGDTATFTNGSIKVYY